MSEMKTGYPSIDRPWLKYYDKDVEKAVVPSESIYMRLERCNKGRLDKPALELRLSNNDFKRGPILTFRDYLARINECARALYALGVEKDEIVPMIIPNVPESRIFIYAVNIIGATAYPISPMASTGMLEKIIEENHVKILVIFDALWEKFSSAVSSEHIEKIIHLSGTESFPFIMRKIAKFKKSAIPRDKKNISYDYFISLKDQCKNNLDPYYDPNHIAVVIGTSGTTGTSKGVCLTDDCLNALSLEQEIAKIFCVGELSLDALISSIGYGISMEHSFGCLGVHCILIPELITDVFPHVLCKTKPDSFAGGPVHYINLYRSPEFKNGIVPPVRNLISGGASLDKELEMNINGVCEGYVEKPGDIIIVRQGYGATECCGSATYAVHGSYKFGGIGIPLPLENMGIFEPETDRELKYGEEGEICITGPTIMSGYLNNPSETEKVMKRHSDGSIWLHLADLGHCDSDGQFYITDRIKNIFMRTGFNVHPSKIAEFITTQPCVEECCVVGIEHPDQQCVPVAFVVKDSVSNIDDNILREELIRACYENLAETDIPYEWIFVNSIPRNMGGKMDMNKLLSDYPISFS
ncbi:MAG: acyl--CoA ligase [Mogibacterium sp.]|nr:acyl--CoA ligase [Mogibacterium sp.]